MLRNMLLASLPMIFVTACGDSGTGGDKAPRKVGESRTDLSGTWDAACRPRGPLGLITTSSEKLSWTFDKAPGDVELTTDKFSDGDCAAPLYKRKLTGTYAVVGAAEDKAGTQGASNLNITVHGMSLTPVGAAGAAKMNEAKTCGRTDWQDGVAVDALGLDCDGASATAGQVVFDVYKVEKADTDRLFLGKESWLRDGSSAEQRPHELDLEHPLVRG